LILDFTVALIDPFDIPHWKKTDIEKDANIMAY